MSERTTIGGTVYESVGSSSSNLLLKCNGTARIQWGSKLIDLIKNGKIASESSSSPIIFNIKDESEIKQDGVYILTKDENTQILICKDKNKYDLTSAKLYIEADTEQSLTSDQKKCALLNIGAYYNTYSDLEQSGVKDGIVYVMDTKTLYTVQNGSIEEFEAKVKTISVNESETSNIINDSVQIVLSINDQQYLVLADGMITSNQSIHVHQAAQIGSEGANSSQGYRLFIDGGTSVLEVDEIRVRNGIPQNDYIVVSYSDLCGKINTNSLSPNTWYYIKDFQNHWKLPSESPTNNRPILIRALTNNSFYKEGLLFSDQRVSIQYDPTYREIIQFNDKSFKAMGRITLMRDEKGNEANFDFLDYFDCEGNELAVLYDRAIVGGKTIFPPQSYNNKLTAYDLKGVDIDTQGNLYTNDTGTIIQFGDDAEWGGEFHDNIIECRKTFTIKSSCQKFYNNKLVKVGNITVNNNIYDSSISNMYTTQTVTVVSDNTSSDWNDLYEVNPYNPTDLNYKEGIIDNFAVLENLTNSSFAPIVLTCEIINTVFEGIVNSQINANVLNSSFGIVNKTVLGNQLTIFKNLQFKNIYNCKFNTDGNSLLDVSCIFDIHNCTFTYRDNSALYDPSVIKELTLITGEEKKTYYIQILRKKESTFFRGMIVMHSGITAIPEGWAVCDGGTYEYLGESITTPNLTGRFIKAVTSKESIGAVDNSDFIAGTNTFQLKKEHLPNHNHTISLSTNTETTQDKTLKITPGDVEESLQYVEQVNQTTQLVTTNQSDYENKIINMEPQSYALIFIMKL